MAKFFKRVAAPEIQGRQAKAPSGPTVDINARQEALNETGGIGGAIQSLLGIATEGVKALDSKSKVDTQIMENEKGIDADADAYNSASSMDNALQVKADEEGKQVEDMTFEELKDFIPEATSNYIKEKDLGDKEYLPIIKTRIQEKLESYITKKNTINQELRKETSYKKFLFKAAGDFKNADANDMSGFSKEYKSRIKDSIGIGLNEDGSRKAIQDKSINGTMRLLENLVRTAVENRDPLASDKIKALQKEGLFEGIDDVDNAINVIEQQTHSVVNKQRQLNFDGTEERVFASIKAGSLKSISDLNKLFKSEDAKYKNEDGIDNVHAKFRPDSKDMVRLRAQATKSMSEEVSFQNIYNKVKGGDFAAVDRELDTEKEKEAFHNKYFSVETGIDDMTTNGILEAMASGDVDATYQSFHQSGARLPKAVTLAFDTMPIAGGGRTLREQQQLQVNAYKQMVGVTQSTGNGIAHQLKAATVTRILHTSSMLDKVQDGTLDEREAQESMSVFSNDLKRNIDSRGIYTSPKAEESMTKEIKEEISEYASEVPWTTDSAFSADYIGRQVLNNYNLFVDFNTPEEALKKAQESFEGSNKRFENDDGSEGILPSDFRHFEVEDVKAMILKHPKITAITDIHTSLDKAYRVFGAIAVHPSNTFENDGLMEIHYDGVPIIGTRMTVNQMNNNINLMKEEERSKIEADFTQERLDKIENN